MRRIKIGLLISVLLSLNVLVAAQQQFQTEGARQTKSLQELVNEAAHAALTKFADKKLTEN